MKEELNINSQRAKKARLSKLFNKSVTKFLLFIFIAFVFVGIIMIFEQIYANLGYFVIAMALFGIMYIFWIMMDLAYLPASKQLNSVDDILEKRLLASIYKKDLPLNPKKSWLLAIKQWEAIFICNRLQIGSSTVADALSENSDDMKSVWQTALSKMTESGSPTINAGILAYSLIVNSREAQQVLATLNIQKEEVADVFEWMNRVSHHLDQPKPYFGGIGRDWAMGYTPNLEHFGLNLSSVIEKGGGAYHTLAHDDILDTIVYNLGNSSGGVALVGEVGTGKTSLVYALAERLLEGKDKDLMHYQIISLNASLIISSAGDKLENLLLTLMSEAIHAGNIIIFLDEANLFFGKGTGAFDAGKVLQPILTNRQLKILAAFTPNDFQRLRISNESLAGSFTNVTINQPEKEVVLDILEDSALTLEHQSGLLVTSDAVDNAYRLSGQYMQEDAYPGKAITLLNQAAAYATNKIINAQSVAMAIEKTRGVRVSTVQAPEADVLLNLENNIHSRMINQTRAVNVVSAALRRTRAGVSSGKRPVGSFLFLGPTGVGKTELARSLAAIYFGDEKQMIRLDMSEYQQAEGVDRLLSDGGNSDQSLIMSIRKQPFSVVLLDEIEKAHPNILNLLLQMLDEGRLTDSNGRPAAFNSAIIICTSNAGSAQITQQVIGGKPLEEFERPLTDELIANGQFRPELINRFDEVVLFRPLNQQELMQVAKLMLGEVNATLSNKNITVELTADAMAHIVKAGFDPQFGARPMRRTIQKMVEDAVAVRILRGDAKSGQIITLDVADLSNPE